MWSGMVCRVVWDLALILWHWSTAWMGVCGGYRGQYVPPPPRPSQVVKVRTQQLSCHQLNTFIHPPPPSNIHPRAIVISGKLREEHEGNNCVFTVHRTDCFFFCIGTEPKPITKQTLWLLTLYFVIRKQSSKVVVV